MILVVDGSNGKVCTACRILKPIEEFYANRRGRLGRHSRCKRCANAATKVSRQKCDPDNLKRRARENAGRRENPERIRRNNLKSQYGITIEDYEAMVERQRGLCAICGRPPLGKGKNSRLHVDHCHRTRRVRGLLCSNCNLGLGNLGDDPDVLSRAIAYLEANRVAA